MNLSEQNTIYIKQRKELAELFGFETRNKYEICSEDGNVIGFAAEQGKGIFGFLLRSFLGHWRRFEIHVFNNDRELEFKAVHPFRIFFQRLEIFDKNENLIGALQQRFAILSKKFDFETPSGDVLYSVSSPFWRIWTFPIKKNGEEIAKIEKKWSGGLKEIFTDADNFKVSFASIEENGKKLITCAAIFVDLQYFEKKASE